MMLTASLYLNVITVKSIVKNKHVLFKTPNTVEYRLYSIRLNFTSVSIFYYPTFTDKIYFLLQKFTTIFISIEHDFQRQIPIGQFLWIKCGIPTT